MKQGYLIVIEGIDGTGKSTQAKRLAEWLSSLGHSVTLSREPTDGPWGKKLRESASSGRLAPELELEWFLLDRKQHVESLIHPAIANGHFVILDRYYFSTMAYQGARGLDPSAIRCQNESFAPVPNLLLILDIDVQTAHQRIGNRGDSTNEFEQLDNLLKCRQTFLSLQHEPFASLIPAHGSPDEVFALIQTAVSRLLP